MLKNIFLLCDSYPLNNGEYFLDDEVNLLSKKFGKIYILTASLSHKNARERPSNVTSLKYFQPSKLNNILNVFNFAFSLGYNIIHLIEYDMNVYDFSEFEKNTEIIKNGNCDCIYYTTGNWFHGEYCAHKISKYFTRFEDTDILEKIIKNNGNCEMTSIELFNEWYGSERVLIKQDCMKIDQSVTSVSSNPNFILFENLGRIFVYLENYSSTSMENIVIYHSYGKIEIRELGSKIYNLFDIANQGEYIFVHLLIDSKIVAKFDINSEDDYKKFISVNYLITN